MKRIISLVVLCLMVSSVAFAVGDQQEVIEKGEALDDIILEKGTTFTIKNTTMEDFDSIFEKEIKSYGIDNQIQSAPLPSSNQRVLNMPYSTTGPVPGTQVNGYFNIWVNYTVVNFDGTNYDIFVSIVDKTSSLASGIYNFHDKGELVATITDGGTRLTASQLLGFEYATTTQITGGLSFGWEFSYSISGTYYYRNLTSLYTARETLPAFYIIY